MDTKQKNGINKKNLDIIAIGTDPIHISIQYI
jgi:hypothetical protein